MFIAGAGCTPMISLGIPYLDENVSKENSPLYVGLFQTSGIFGKCFICATESDLRLAFERNKSFVFWQPGKHKEYASRSRSKHCYCINFTG